MRVFIVLYVLMLTFIVFWWKTSRDDYQLSDTHHPYDPLSQLLGLDDSFTNNGKSQGDIFKLSSDREPYISHFFNHKKSFCHGDFTAYKNLFAKLRNVTVDTEYGHGKRGGENISEVLNQQESEEFYRFHRGFFKLPCGENIRYDFGQESHLNGWLAALHTQPSPVKYKRYSEWTVAITRYEYANLYHTMTDFYNTFLVLKVFKVRPENATVLVVDGHPLGALDDTWKVLFKRVIRVGEFTEPVLFENMIWSIIGYDSPLNEHDLPSAPYLEEFRHQFLSKHGVQTDYELNCDKLNILLLWRHDYLAHPRNPSGRVSRKIKNEDELLQKITETLNGHDVNGLQIDLYPMPKQLEIIAKTDLLIGMHGAGLSHTMFLPRHAGLLEMYPMYYSPDNRHFRQMAEWRHLHYSVWLHYEPERDINDELTIVNVDEVAQLAQNMVQRICKTV